MAVVDASVLVEFLAPDADDAGTAAALFAHWAEAGEALHAPAVLRLEVMNALLTGVRRGRWDGLAADQAAGLSAALPIQTHDEDTDRARAWELARRYDNHPIYDMVYVALAERLGQPLVSLDDKLRARLAALNRVLRPEDVLQRARAATSVDGDRDGSAGPA